MQHVEAAVVRLIPIDAFQSSPAPEGECNMVRLLPVALPAVFQSSPAPEGECNLTVQPVPLTPASFNPHPPLRASATGS